MACSPALPGVFPALSNLKTHNVRPLQPSLSSHRSSSHGIRQSETRFCPPQKLRIRQDAPSMQLYGGKILASTLSVCKRNEHPVRSASIVRDSPLSAERPDSQDAKSHKTEFRPDEWLDHCILEVVKNIQEAPFLQLVYESRGNTRTERRLVACDLGSEQQPEEEASWCNVKDALAKASPDGVILVQKLHPDPSVDAPMADSETPSIGHSAAANSRPCNGIHATDVWGLLLLGESPVQNACYILETTRVSSCAGICTRFCLTRAQCFGPSVREQLERMWLLSSSG